MITIRQLARMIVESDSFDSPGDERVLAAIDREVKSLLNTAQAHIIDRPGTKYTVQVEVDCREEFPELQDLNRRF